jgi:hypothetical protein
MNTTNIVILAIRIQLKLDFMRYASLWGGLQTNFCNPKTVCVGAKVPSRKSARSSEYKVKVVICSLFFFGGVCIFNPS